AVAPGGVHPPPRPAGDDMNVVSKLAGFAAVLALVFAGAAFAGSRLDVHPGRAAAEAPAHMGATAARSVPVRGPARTHGRHGGADDARARPRGQRPRPHAPARAAYRAAGPALRAGLPDR